MLNFQQPWPTLLLVDDDPLMQELMTEFIGAAAARFLRADSGGAALDLAAAEQPALILLDVVMPGLDGFETCRRLRADPLTADIPVVFITAAAEPEDIAKAFAAGAADYVRKPLEATELRTRVSHQLLLIDARRRDRQRLHDGEKLAQLGAMVGAMTHEIGTPIGNARLAISSFASALTALRSDRDAGRLSKSGFDQFLARGDEAVGVAEQAIGFAAQLLDGFKSVAVDQCSGRRGRVRVADYLDKILLSLRPKLKKTAIRTELLGPTELDIDTDPGALAQIVTNLVESSLIHGFDPGASGTIRIRFGCEGESFLLCYEDDGKGMSADVLANVFEAYFTTRAGSGGSGLGMHIVWALVRERLGGRIDCSSAPGVGVRFDIHLPLRAGAEQQ